MLAPTSRDAARGDGAALDAPLRRDVRGMNSDLRLIVRPSAPTEQARAQATAALDASVAWLAAMEQRCSRFSPASELSALNASAGGWFRASADLYAVVGLALEAARRTRGLFDPTVLPALVAAGYDRSFEQIERGERETPDAAPQTPAPRWSAGRWREVRLDPAHRSIALPLGVALDLGGIAKGWAADALAQRYLDPFPAYLIDLGGDLRLRGGPAEGRPWLVGIEQPTAAMSPGDAGEGETPRYLACMPIAAGGIATSGDARRWWLRGGHRLHHLIDPRTGRPAHSSSAAGELTRRPLTWTALAPTTAEADVLAKVAFLLGYPTGLRMLTRHAAGVCAWADGRIEATPNLEEYLHALASASVSSLS